MELVFVFTMNCDENSRVKYYISVIFVLNAKNYFSKGIYVTVNVIVILYGTLVSLL